MYIIFLGAPGTGKGTQAAIIAEKLGLLHLATGDMFRQALGHKSALGVQAKSYMEMGMLVPDDITISIVLERLSAPDCKAGIILDGFPRNLQQAEALDQALAQQGKIIDKAVFIKISKDKLLKRLSGRWICRNCQVPYHEIDSPPDVRGECDLCGGELYQRPDDNVETIKKRLHVYFAETVSLIDYYAQTDKLLEIDGEGDIQEISSKIVVALLERANK